MNDPLRTEEQVARKCGESTSWGSLRPCGQPAQFVSRGAVTRYLCVTHAQRYKRLQRPLEALRVH